MCVPASLVALHVAADSRAATGRANGRSRRRRARSTGPCGADRQDRDSSTGTYPDTWSATENVAWKKPVPGRGNSSPIVWGDRIFLTTAHEGGRRVSLIAFRRSDGTQLWETFAPDGRTRARALQERSRIGDAVDRRHARLRLVRQPRSCGVRFQRQARLAQGSRRRRQLPRRGGLAAALQEPRHPLPGF